MIDTHAHLQFPQFAEDYHTVLENADKAGIEYIIVIGIDIESSKKAVVMAEQNEKLLASVGIHPHDASLTDNSALEQLQQLAHHPKVVAIGETGLDFYRNLSPREEQIEAFQAQLALAEKMGLPVIIHDRDAHEPIVEILSEYVERLTGGVMHCFSGDVSLAQKMLDWGFYISIAGPLTYPNATALRSVVEQVPIEKIVIETDAPYLTPQPERGKRNEPAYVRFIAEELARIKGLSVDDIDRITSLNAQRLFGALSIENGD